jgi:hypothetical protein
VPVERFSLNFLELAFVLILRLPGYPGSAIFNQSQKIMQQPVNSKNSPRQHAYPMRLAGQCARRSAWDMRAGRVLISIFKPG